MLNERAELYKYNALTPTLSDGAYLAYTEGADSLNNPLMGYSVNDMNNSYQSRGAFPVTITSIQKGAIGGALAPVNLANVSLKTALTANNGVGTNFVVGLSFTVYEPILLSPFIFGDCVNHQGFYGIQNMSITANVGGTSRVWSSMNLPSRNITSITLNGFTNAQLILNYLTPQPSQLLSSRNTVPYYSLPRYISSSGGPNTFAAMQASTYNPTITSYGPCPGILPSSQTIVSSSIQLNCIPDKLIIFVRPSLSQTQTPWNVATTFLVIQNISLNFNNSSGLLSSVSQYSLWQMSVENGSTQSWGEFSGWQWKSLMEATWLPFLLKAVF